mgnify:CR=1 FL=1
MSTKRRHWGQILYQAEGQVSGYEDFSMDVRDDGRTIRSYCEMAENDLTRDASWTLDTAHKPVEGHVRVVQNGSLAGSAWYHCSQAGTECESLTPGMGRTSQKLAVSPSYLGLHPLVGDGLIALARGIDNAGEERMVESVTCSYDENGGTSLVALPIQIGVTFVGPEDITVQAGTFPSYHYELNWQPQWPRAKLWVMQEDAVFLRLTWSHVSAQYDLAKYGVSNRAKSPQFDGLFLDDLI